MTKRKAESTLSAAGSGAASATPADRKAETPGLVVTWWAIVSKSDGEPTLFVRAVKPAPYSGGELPEDVRAWESLQGGCTARPATAEEVAAGLSDVAGPVVSRPKVGRGGEPVVYVDNPEPSLKTPNGGQICPTHHAVCRIVKRSFGLLRAECPVCPFSVPFVKPGDKPKHESSSRRDFDLSGRDGPLWGQR